jgi:hypothetical protein
MLMPASPLTRLDLFRTELHACCTRRADTLFELGDALLCAQTPLPSLPHLRLEPTHRSGPATRYPPPGHQAKEEGHQARQGRLTGPPPAPPTADEISGQPSMPTGLKRKLRLRVLLGYFAVCAACPVARSGRGCAGRRRWAAHRFLPTRK